jgi:F-type H+-transporting ATPase subunit b
VFLKIDWTTLIFQTINFLVLVAILSKFLFRPVLRIIEQRRQEVQSRLDDAAREQTEGKLLKEQYQAQLALADEQRSELLARAKTEAEMERDKTIQEGEEYARNRKEQTDKYLARRSEQALVDSRNEIIETALSLSDRMLSDIANSELSQSYVDRFMKEMLSMGSDEKERLRTAAKDGVVIVSAYPITAHQEQEITALLGGNAASYQEDRSLLAGVSIQAGDICLDGSLKGQLKEIRARMEVETRESST